MSDRYEIRKSIGKGGLSEIFLVYDKESKLNVVIKMLNLKLNSAHTGLEHNYFLREVEVLRQLRHIGIVKLFPIYTPESSTGTTAHYRGNYNIEGKYKGRMYLVEEYLPSKPLSNNKRQLEISQMSSGWKVELIYRILTIVKYVHDNNWAHCDLKPSNIMFREDRIHYQPCPVLIDFGSASTIGKYDTHIPTESGRYSAPELRHFVNSKSTRDRATIKPAMLDVYSLGVIMYEILSSNVFTPDVGRFKRLINSADISNRTEKGLIKLIKQMTEKNPNARPSLDDVIELLDVHLFPPPRTQGYDGA